MAFRLAGHLGMTVRELEERMDAVEFREWIDYLNLEAGDDGKTGIERLFNAAIPARK